MLKRTELLRSINSKLPANLLQRVIISAVTKTHGTKFVLYVIFSHSSFTPSIMIFKLGSTIAADSIILINFRFMSAVAASYPAVYGISPKL